jgi:hypothetical protein
LHGPRSTPNKSGQNHDHRVTSVHDTLFICSTAMRIVQGIIACFDPLIDSWWRLRLPHPAPPRLRLIDLGPDDHAFARWWLH